MSYLQNFLLSLLIAVPAIIGLVNYKKMNPSYRPFIWVCVAVSTNEIVKYFLIQMGNYDYVSYNIALPIICFLYLWLFYSWGLFKGKENRLKILAALLLAIWIADHFILNGYRLPERTNYFRIAYSLTLVLLSVNTINRLILTEKQNLLLNSCFLICIALAIYYTYRIIIDAFKLNHMSNQFFHDLENINRSLNTGLNLIFVLAALWIPKKKNFTIQF
jgi:hypothetical protein